MIGLFLASPVYASTVNEREEAMVVELQQIASHLEKIAKSLDKTVVPPESPKEKEYTVPKIEPTKKQPEYSY